VRVFLSAESEADLDRIAAYIAESSPDRAEAFVRELRVACSDLALAPRAFALVPRFARTGIRRRVYGNYLIFYRVDAAAIRIVRVFHGAQDYSRLLRGH
jgi:toxin ParE1/3/4